MTMAQSERSDAGWVPEDDTFGARLAMVRQRMGWGNVKEAAIACGLPPESWRTWERDGVAPRRVVDAAALISDRTGVDFDWLLRGRRRPSADVVRYHPVKRRRVTEESVRRTRPLDRRPAGTPGGIPTPRSTTRAAA